MNPIRPGLYFGKVVHKRLRPVVHDLSYSVATLLVDVEQLHAKHLPGLLSYNRFNLFSLRDSDHGDRLNSLPLADFARAKMAEIGVSQHIARIYMLSYPRILGYAFNPLTTFYGIDASGNIRAMIYEVHNTFGGRHCYPAGPFNDQQQLHFKVQKTFRVSPFNGIEGHYDLTATIPGDAVSVGVALTTADGPTLKAYFSGHYQPLSNMTLLKVFFGLPFMTLKVVLGIHWEALKLWRKGLKLQSP